jgi:hypothetical protein
VGTATRRMILVGTVALFSLLTIPRVAAQIPNPGDVQDTADDATQGAQDAVDDVQDTADDATQGAQDAVDDVQDTADDATQGTQDAVDDVQDTADDATQGAQGAVDDTANDATQGAQGAVDDVQDTVGNTAAGAADKASSAVTGSSKKKQRSVAKQRSGGERSATTASDKDASSADLAELIAAGHSIEGTIDASLNTGSDERGPLERAWDFLGLPMTGAELLAVVGVGVLFISAGAVLWKRARSRTLGGQRDGAIPDT